MLKLFFTTCLALWSVYGWAGECHTANYSPYVYNASFGTINVTNSANNRAGYTIPNAYTWNLGGDYYPICSCSGTYTAVYYTTKTNLAIGHYGGIQFYKVNDYLEVATDVYVGGNVMSYINTPLNKVSNYSPSATACNNPTNFNTGSKGHLTLYITKPFISNSSFSVTVFSLYGTTNPGDALGPYPMTEVHLSGSVVVPQNCTINAGQVITVDFGTMLSSSFKTAGEKPTGMTDKTFNVPIKCANVDGAANLALRVAATPASGNANAIASNNADVGVVVTSEQGNVLTPNNKSSVVPFNVDSSGNASVTLKAYPISTTGKQPKEGLFTALATLVIDFA